MTHDNSFDDLNRNILPEFPNLCIPRVNIFVTKEQVFEIINKYSLGSIQKIDVIKKKGDCKKGDCKKGDCKKGDCKKNDISNMVFIYFNEWYDNALANSVKDRLMSGKDIKIIYDDPWYWKIFALKV